MKSRKSEKHAAGRLVAGAIVLGVGLCLASDGAIAKNETLRVGLSPYPNLSPVALGVEKGWYEEAGIDLDVKILEWGETIEALAAGAVDITNACDVDVLTKRDNFPGIVFSNIVFFSVGSGVLVRPDSEIKTFQEMLAETGGDAKAAIAKTGEQLRGKTAIAARNTDHELTIMILARRGGVDPVTEMEWIDMTPPEGLAAFLTGTGDLYNGGIPQRMRGVELGNKLLVTLKDLKPEGVNYCGFATTREFADENPDLLAAFQNVAYQNHKYIEDHPDEAFGILQAWIKEVTGNEVPIDNFKTEWAELALFPSSGRQFAAEAIDPTGDYYWRPRFELVAQTYGGAGLIKNPIDLHDVAAFTRLQDAYTSKYGDQ